MPPRRENVPESASIPGENVVAVGKHPCFGGKTGRKCRRGGKMSRKAPQNQEKHSPQKKNVPETATKPGEDVRFRRLSGTFVNVKTD